MEKQCIHHWDIAEAKGLISIGICKYCKKTKEFPNCFQELPTYFNRPYHAYIPLSLTSLLPSIGIDKVVK